ncbi:outer membrane beta-barrel protein [Mucilaginibacter jinjuensis]|uniref:Outer membrane beta-barrel protein n=1 Tax=Mucilaginibacter jinjuensis TaxID=1176721 RepID=A0ABY7TH21_9SPHI|nr:OmpW family outer membrane protein [Mucilaginibacter jinjuensis]WCT14467.1 outer membrane beta-barrel protein [Mucilaginibacter jinjuensis]
MKKTLYIIALLLGFYQYAQGQTSVNKSPEFDRDLFFVGYEVAIPTNTNYLTKTSWSGARFDYRRMINQNVSVGIGVSFNSFNQYFKEQTYQRPDGTGAVTSDMIRQIYTTPITASVQYYFPGKMIKPYVGLGLGTEYSEQNAYLNIYSISTKNWGFAVRPEIGATTKFNEMVGAFVSAAYNYSTNNNDSFHINHLSQFPITIGVIFIAP